MKDYTIWNKVKTDLERYPQKKMTEKERDRAIERFCKEQSLAGKGKAKSRFLWKAAAWAAAVTLLAIAGGMSVSYATGIGPAKTVLQRFSDRDNQVIKEKEETGRSEGKKELKYQICMDECYLDRLGNGYITFSIMKSDGARVKPDDLHLNAFFIRNGVKQNFYKYEFRSILSEDQKYMDGILLEFNSEAFVKAQEALVIRCQSQDYTFQEVEVTQPHYYKWNTEKGIVKLSSVGMWLQNNTDVAEEITKHLASENSGDEIASVQYRDGSKKKLWLNAFFGDENSESKDATVQFSPCTKLEEHLRRGESGAEIEAEWDYHYSIYLFNLDQLSSVTVGETTLYTKDATLQ